MEWAPWLLLVTVVFGQWLVVLTWRLTEQRDEIAELDHRGNAVYDENTRMDMRLYAAEATLRRIADPILFAPRSPWCHVVDTIQAEGGS